MTTAADDQGEDIAAEDAVLEFESGIEEEIVLAIEAGNLDGVRDLVAQLHYADVADLLEHLDEDGRDTLIEAFQGVLDSDVFAELDESVRDDLVEKLGVAYVASAVSEMDTDDAVQVIEELEEHEQKQVLEAIPAGERTLIEEGLAYPEDSAGRLMQREVMTVPEFWNVGETIDFLRQQADAEEAGQDAGSLPDLFYDIFVVDPSHKPVGSVALSRLLRSRRPVTITDIISSEMKLVQVDEDQEDVAYLFGQRDLVSAPVVDAAGRLVGVITVDDVVDVIHEEHEEDIMRLGGVREDDLYEAVGDTTRARFSWLLLNLGTAILASVIIGFFEATIEQIVALAVLMPIVASMGGNAGTQTLTVTVRALAMKDLTSTNAMRVVGKEVLVGSINGVLFAVLAGVVAWLWFDSQALGLVIGLAMIINMVVAGLAGTTIPLVLERNGIDPAIASSVFLTTITDVVGFAAFLGLAAWMLI
ncbi:MAG: magnesium transporter [Rhodospirillaceae bacterium]|jgi:magnesium transporter|nr:magnesium transporter [Rhodospirillaceae bacterium]MBT5563627.1 magnesium transporter [Rhodospirillaceae bacterium]MBT6241457.1 magnesium transporter [Rhodospirillaceae bacterium]MBT7138840.1 magnesium transporter [Rhodospirillaceae bacterium]